MTNFTTNALLSSSWALVKTPVSPVFYLESKIRPVGVHLVAGVRKNFLALFCLHPVFVPQITVP
jgi:hypothetical protein